MNFYSVGVINYHYQDALGNDLQPTNQGTANIASKYQTSGDTKTAFDKLIAAGWQLNSVSATDSTNFTADPNNGGDDSVNVTPNGNSITYVFGPKTQTVTPDAPKSGVDLAPISLTKKSQTFDLKGVNVKKYSDVLIFCDKAHALFGHATYMAGSDDMMNTAATLMG